MTKSRVHLKINASLESRKYNILIIKFCHGTTTYKYIDTLIKCIHVMHPQIPPLPSVGREAFSVLLCLCHWRPPALPFCGTNSTPCTKCQHYPAKLWRFQLLVW
jgi:hypothetical protein